MCKLLTALQCVTIKRENAWKKTTTKGMVFHVLNLNNANDKMKRKRRKVKYKTNEEKRFLFFLLLLFRKDTKVSTKGINKES